MDRPTKTFKTDKGHEIELYTYATGREFQAIQNALIGSMDLGIEGQEPKVESIDFEKQTEANNEAIKTLVVSVDGEEEDVLDKVLDLPSDDYQEVLDKVNDLTGKASGSDTDEA